MRKMDNTWMSIDVIWFCLFVALSCLSGKCRKMLVVWILLMQSIINHWEFSVQSYRMSSLDLNLSEDNSKLSNTDTKHSGQNCKCWIRKATVTQIMSSHSVTNVLSMKHNVVLLNRIVIFQTFAESIKFIPSCGFRLFCTVRVTIVWVHRHYFLHCVLITPCIIK